MRIFGLGLSRTGTSSLSRALEILGYRSNHYPSVSYRFGHFFGLKRQDLRNFDAFSDISILPIYRQLDRKFPGAKFIFTTREKEAWLSSCANFERLKAGYAVNAKTRAIRRAVYGCETFDRERFSSAYDRHEQEIRAYFATRPGDLLVLNVCAGQDWSALCQFLGKDIPDGPFPHDNRGVASSLPMAG